MSEITGKYFTLYELIQSSVAEEKGINNTPQEEDIIKNIEELIVFLDDIRENWGSAIKVNSGYRCPLLNKSVGGSSTSSHLFGFAVDLVPVNGLIDDFFEFVKNYLLSNDIPFDQLIDEHSGNVHWVHIGYKNLSGEQRKEIKVFKNGKYEKI